MSEWDEKKRKDKMKWRAAVRAMCILTWFVGMCMAIIYFGLKVLF